jgi:hypothetical protein
MLLDAGAEVNAQGGRYGNTLQAASGGGHEKVVQILLEKGAADGRRDSENSDDPPKVKVILKQEFTAGFRAKLST